MLMIAPVKFLFKQKKKHAMMSQTEARLCQEAGKQPRNSHKVSTLYPKRTFSHD